jgi:hypothetical protein
MQKECIFIHELKTAIPWPSWNSPARSRSRIKSQSLLLAPVIPEFGRALFDREVIQILEKGENPRGIFEPESGD